MVAHVCHPSIGKAEAGGLPQVLCHSDLQSNILSKKNRIMQQNKTIHSIRWSGCFFPFDYDELEEKDSLSLALLVQNLPGKKNPWMTLLSLEEPEPRRNNGYIRNNFDFLTLFGDNPDLRRCLEWNSKSKF